MDIARRAYKTECRFLRDSGTVSTIRWVEARPEAPALPFPSIISSLDLDKPDYDYTGPGEVRGAPRPFTGQKAPMGLNGNHYCGTPTDFTQGGEYLPDLPPAAYDAQGYLVCCAVPEPPPPPPPPNVTCETALPIAIGDVVPFETLGGVQRWYKFEQDEVGPLKLVTTNDLGLTNVQAIRGDCPPAGIVAEIFFGGCQTFSMTPIGPYRAVVTAFNPGINTGTLSIQRGTC